MNESDKLDRENLKNPSMSAGEAIERLIAIVGILRVECPWDRVQTHRSLRNCMLEEVYEVAEAIDKGDVENLREELGDVLLHVIFHSIMANEVKEFDFVQVANDECEKMIRRHPHVFLYKQVKTVDKVIEKWENIKEQEHNNYKVLSKMENIPSALPSLMRSHKIQKKAAEVGFDWDSPRGAFEKLVEEKEELFEAIDADDRDAMTEELGDLLFSVVNVARLLKIDAEEALDKSNQKFMSRFAYVEDKAESMGKRLKDMKLCDMDNLWEESKLLEINRKK